MTALGEALDLPFRGELRYGLELARLAADREFVRPRRRADAPPVLLVPGFLAGDQSLAVLAGWLRRRGSRTSGAGMLMNVDCAERAAGGLERRLRRLAERTGRPVVVIGQSRGGELGRVLAARHPEHVSALVMLGAPVVRPLNVRPGVLRAVRSVAFLGDRGMPGVFSSKCADGDCCTAYWEDLRRPLPASVDAVTVYSRTDGVVDWRACLDPWARPVEVDSSHTGMSVNRAVYAVMAEILNSRTEAAA
jgi:pimeloyl-ACP methyl ester carboxylesterase